VINVVLRWLPRINVYAIDVVLPVCHAMGALPFLRRRIRVANDAPHTLPLFHGGDATQLPAVSRDAA